MKLGSPKLHQEIIPLHIRTINKQIKIHASGAGIRGKRISTQTLRKTFGREVWKRNGQTEACSVKLSSLFNHSSIAITRLYLSINKEKVDNLHQLQDLFVY